ncbi:acyl-CoA synthetase (AMP-forming)/AMP-acid ligase II [Prauserella shujinwangii]|uniref:Acyl-CoA synthetase (AMP-forming)/AMP-acid ligase II n=1 Tax=Prauserella shujinwangii TaxID=1453103 RepID=A0A2T0LL28_9PSEU|nr:AMP-binding protein [Prauserella shujinwangii]PRX43655.1 acyl-CoA synthetase (AMP-forming)/AMP-acid ligase II [Prauserella shujinwangii]
MTVECAVFDVFVDQPRAELWKILADPERYPRFFRGIGSCERVAADGRRRTYRMRVREEGAVVPLEVDTVQYRRGEHFVLESLKGATGCVSVHLEDAGVAGTRVKVYFFRTAVAHREFAEPEIRAWLTDGIRRIDDHLGGIGAPLPVWSPPTQLKAARTLMDAGVIAPSSPAKIIRQLRALSRWGATLAGGYQAAAASAPDAIAVADEETRWTFADLDRRTTRLAWGLREIGVGAGRTVAVLARNHAALLHVLIACGKLGAHTLLLNTGLAGRQVAEAVHRHRARVVFGDPEFDEHLAGLRDDVLVVGTLGGRSGRRRVTVDDLIATEPGGPLTPPDRPGRLVVLTSGTSGTPKGARRPTPKGLGAALALLSRIPLRAGERMLVAAPVFHTWGLAAVQVGMPLHAGLVLRRRFDPEDCLQAIEQYRCTSMFAVPVMLQRIMDLPAKVRGRYDTSSLRVVASSGSALPPKLVTDFLDAFGDVLYNLYGSTEVSVATVAGPADLRAAPGTAGYPPLGSQVAVLEPTGDPAPPGAVGRVFVRNDMLFDGYTDGSGRERRHSLMDTGDRGYLDADGRLFVAGRDDDMIVSGGENVFPRSVEDALATMPGVNEAAAVGVPDPEFGHRLLAYVVTSPEAQLSAGDVLAFLRQRIPRFCMPREVLFTHELPRNATGKVLKRLLVPPGDRRAADAGKTHRR